MSGSVFMWGGRTQFDAVWLDASDDVSAALSGAGVSDAVSIRRARLRVDGTMYGFIDWAAEYDFVNSVNDNAGLVGGLPDQPATEANVVNVTAPTDLWVTFTKLNWIGNIRVGHFKEPIGMEHMTSSRYLDFLERSFLQDAYFGTFNNGFTPGISVFNWSENERVTWAIGLFKNTTNIFGYGIGDGEAAGTGRMTFLPLYEDEGKRLIHLGVSASVREPNDQLQRIRTRASLRNGPGSLNPVFADTGNFESTLQELAGLEAAWVHGPLTVQAEYSAGWNNEARLTPTSPDLGTYFSHGYYVQAFYFLTGEYREYEKHHGVFGRVIPNRNFSLRDPCGDRGWGAWQVGARYARLDLTDSGIDGGEVEDVTLGTNWFLNPNMKVQFNYVITYRDAPVVAGPDADGVVHGAGLRLAMDF